MKQISIIIIILLSISFTDVYANPQKGVIISKEEKTAKKYRKKADRLYRNEKPLAAIEYYKKAYDISPENVKLNTSLGFCYFNLQCYKKSLPYLEKANQLDTQNVELTFFLARNYHFVSNYDTAIIFYNKYLTEKIDISSEMERKIDDYILQCNYAKELIKTPENVLIQKLSNDINTKNHDYSPVYVEKAEALIYTSRRENTIGGLKKFEDNDYFEDIFISSLRIDNKIDSSLQDLKINTRTNDAAAGISGDGNYLFLFSDDNGGDIYFHKLKKDSSDIELFSEKINSRYFESSATSTRDCTMIYFISDRPENNIGGKDIFFSKRDTTGNWSEPENFGNLINTSEDEISVFVSPDGNRLFFSSKGHNSIGGFDIFKTEKDSLGNWQNPQNIGIPINTPSDEVFFSKYEQTGYFSSVNIEEPNGFDIFQVEFLEAEEEIIIDTISDETAELIKRFGDNYNLNLGKDNYLFQNSDFNLIEDSLKNEAEIVDTVKKPDLKFFMNIEFAFNKAAISENSIKSLDTLAYILKFNPDYKIIISGHTDNIGNYESNQTLSEERASMVAKYLIDKGVSNELIETKGFSYSRPIATNQTEEGRAKNRRVEFEFFKIED